MIELPVFVNLKGGPVKPSLAIDPNTDNPGDEEKQTSNAPDWVLPHDNSKLQDSRFMDVRAADNWFERVPRTSGFRRL